jgi:hypothetical protein
MVFKDFTLSLLTKQRTKFIYEKRKLVFRFASKIYIKKHYVFEKPFCYFFSKREFQKKVKQGESIGLKKNQKF